MKCWLAGEYHRLVEHEQWLSYTLQYSAGVPIGDVCIELLDKS